MNKAFYFKNNGCVVCHDLLPKVKNHFLKTYPKLDFEVVEVQENPEYAGQNRVFTVPVLLVILDGREQFRLVRNFSIPEIDQNLSRVYSLVFE